jgi:predicted metalloprotease with PDZ domain
MQSLADSSFDTWIKFYRPDENSPNTRTSYYRKGAVVAFLLDARVRELTGGEKSLDDVMRRLYVEHSTTGYTPSDFRRIASSVAGKDLSQWFTTAVDSTDDLDYVPALQWLGLEFGPSENEKPVADPTSPKNNAEADQPDPKPWLGFIGISPVSRVEAHSPASDSGVNTDDEILAINGFRLTDDLDSRLKQFKVGDELELLIARRGKIQTLTITIGEKPKSEWLLKPAGGPTEQQSANLKKWLGQ